MSKEFLDDSEVCMFQEPGCKGMPQGVRCNGSADGVDRKVFYNTLKITSGKRSVSISGNKKRT